MASAPSSLKQQSEVTTFVVLVENCVHPGVAKFFIVLMFNNVLLVFIHSFDVTYIFFGRLDHNLSLQQCLIQSAAHAGDFSCNLIRQWENQNLKVTTAQLFILK